MTPSKFFLFSIAQLVIFILVKIAYFNQAFFSGRLNDFLFWGVLVVVVVALIRRFGALNYLEAFFLVIMWAVGDLFFDLIITSAYVGQGLKLFFAWQLWVGHFLMAISIFAFHKKRHVALREGLIQDDHHH